MARPSMKVYSSLWWRTTKSQAYFCCCNPQLSCLPCRPPGSFSSSAFRVSVWFVCILGIDLFRGSYNSDLMSSLIRSILIQSSCSLAVLRCFFCLGRPPVTFSRAKGACCYPYSGWCLIAQFVDGKQASLVEGSSWSCGSQGCWPWIGSVIQARNGCLTFSLPVCSFFHRIGNDRAPSSTILIAVSHWNLRCSLVCLGSSWLT